MRGTEEDEDIQMKEEIKFVQKLSLKSTTVNGIKENDISQLVDPVERYTIWQMKVNEFHFMSV